ncbi:MAG TPA: hypothetical protein VGY56_05600 [Verrucomicrobiae bacterium]|nr:hypothetical protein [Verrucomicrobiae bacterium]
MNDLTRKASELMPHGPNPESDARKRAIVSCLDQRFGISRHKHENRPDWYFLRGGGSEVFITDSKAHYDQRPWFDMDESDINELAQNSAAFVIFILGESDSFLVIPANRLLDELQNYVTDRRQIKRGRYYFNLNKNFKPYFKQLPAFDLHPFKGNLELIQSR